MNTPVRFLAIGGVLLAGFGCAAEEGRPPLDSSLGDRLAAADSLVQAWVDEARIPGAVLAVTHRGEVVHARAFGHAHVFEYGAGQYPDGDVLSPAPTERLDGPVPMEVGTVFDLASVTKVMATTMAMMLLVDRGLVDLDAPLSRWLPAFATGERATITPRMLLTHTSGLPQWWPTYYHASAPTEVWTWMDSIPLTWTPGTERHYSDLGFMTLGRLVEAVSGTPLDDFVAHEFYGPLALGTIGFRPEGAAGQPVAPGEIAATSHGNPFERRMVHDTDFGYSIDVDPESWDGWRRRVLVGEVNDGNAWHAFGGVAGHAGLFADATDLAHLLLFLLADGRGPGGPLVDPATVAAFTSEQVEGQALGWQLPEYAPEGSWGHTGFTGTFVLGVPSRDLGIVLLTNKQNLGVDADTRYTDVGPLNRAVTSVLTANY